MNHRIVISVVLVALAAGGIGIWEWTGWRA